MRVKLPVRPVMVRACAQRALGRPAAYARRYAYSMVTEGFFRTVSFLMGLGLSLSSCSGQVSSTLPKSVAFTDGGRTLVVVGKWVVNSPPAHSSLPSANAVQVVCERDKQVCVESLALLYRPGDRAMPAEGGEHLAVLTERYSVVEWTPTIIRAQAAPRAADLELRISVIDGSVERIARETTARGAQTTEPRNVEHWVLE